MIVHGEAVEVVKAKDIITKTTHPDECLSYYTETSKMVAV
jgi:hypothetical protein